MVKRSTKEKTVPISVAIERSHRKFVADPDHDKGLKRLDHKRLRQATAGLKDNIAIFANYYVFYRNMQSKKILSGKLSEEAERALVERSDEALNTYCAISRSIGAITDVCAESGFDKAIDRHIGALCEHLPYNPKVRVFIPEILDMGITEAEISCVSEELRRHNYNLLRYAGGDGTLKGFANLARSLEPKLEKENRAMKRHGLAVLQGSGGTATGTVVVIIAIVIIAAILCAITVFYS